jgi:hypothetical protein
MKTHALLVLGAVMTLGTGACRNVPVDVMAGSSALSGPTKGSRLGVFEAYWPQRTSAELSARLAGAARGMVGASKAEASLFAPIVEAHASMPDLWSEVTTDLGPRIHVEYYPAKDDLRVTNLDVMDDLSTDQDVGEDGARSVAAGVLASLAADGLLDATHYDVAQAEVSHVMTGVAEAKQQLNPTIQQYRFLMRRRINGIDFMHNGVLIAVHRNGRPAFTRFGGAEIRANSVDGAEQPIGRGSTLAVDVTATEVQARHSAAFPTARGVKSRLFYVFPDGEDSGMVEPRQVVLYSTPHTTPDGHVAISKGRYLAYSIRSVAEQPKYISGDPKPSASADVKVR